ncbi:MAG: hypothetical protein R3F25_10265 [Gammaproteobacteria bacterium]
MSASDVTDTLDDALAFTGDQAHVDHKPDCSVIIAHATYPVSWLII